MGILISWCEKPGFFEKYGGSRKKYRRNPVSGMVADGGDRIYNVGARHQKIIGEDEKVSIAVPRPGGDRKMDCVPRDTGDRQCKAGARQERDCS
ncbi:MAG: hypothetical protein AB4352_26545 [Hormoscilla sp.]